MRVVALLALLAACQSPPLSLRFTLTDGDAQRCQSDTGNETTDCSEVTMQCEAVLGIRIVPPDAKDFPYITVCTPLVGGQHKLCSIAGVDLPEPTVRIPEQVLEVQMAIFAKDTLATDPNGDPICPQVDFAANNLAVAALDCVEGECPPQPAVAGRAYYYPGDTQTIVELGCTNFELLRVCKNVETVGVQAAVNDFETVVSVSPATADRLLLSVGEPVVQQLLGGFWLEPSATHPLDRTVIQPVPGWSTVLTDPMFTSSVCIQVFEDVPQATATVTCTSPVPGNPIEMDGYRLPRGTLSQILAAINQPLFPDQGLVVGIVLNQFYSPVQGAIVTADVGTVKYLSADRMSTTTTSTSSNGIFISEDAPYGSKFHWNGQEQLGGLVLGKVTIVVLRQPIPT